LLGCLLTGIPAGAQENELRLIELHYRTAEEMLPLLRPIAGNDVVLSGRGTQLLARGTPAELQQLAQLIAQLDRAPAQLLILVEQLREADTTQRSLDADGKISLDGTGGSTETDLQLRTHATRGDDSATLRQSVRVLDGHEAFITIGEDMPVIDRTRILSQHGIASRESVDYKPLRSGFTILPQIHGDAVTVTIHPQQMRRTSRAGETIAVQAAATTLRGALDQWIEFAGVAQSETAREGVIVHSTTEESQTRQRFRIKVTRVTP
jgi:type II secretory pathway component GspD/PulD (secretin)